MICISKSLQQNKLQHDEDEVAQHLQVGDKVYLHLPKEQSKYIQPNVKNLDDEILKQKWGLAVKMHIMRNFDHKVQSTL